jgi:hypothetical protein
MPGGIGVVYWYGAAAAAVAMTATSAAGKSTCFFMFKFLSALFH